MQIDVNFRHGCVPGALSAKRRLARRHGAAAPRSISKYAGVRFAWNPSCAQGKVCRGQGLSRGQVSVAAPPGIAEMNRQIAAEGEKDGIVFRRSMRLPRRPDTIDSPPPDPLGGRMPACRTKWVERLFHRLFREWRGYRRHTRACRTSPDLCGMDGSGGRRTSGRRYRPRAPWWERRGCALAHEMGVTGVAWPAFIFAGKLAVSGATRAGRYWRRGDRQGAGRCQRRCKADDAQAAAK